MKTKWISVKDRLPNCNQKMVTSSYSDWVLTIDKEGNFDLDHYIKSAPRMKNNKLEQVSYWRNDMDITHWMPLPQPPKNK